MCTNVKEKTSENLKWRSTLLQNWGEKNEYSHHNLMGTFVDSTTYAYHTRHCSLPLSAASYKGQTGFFPTPSHVEYNLFSHSVHQCDYHCSLLSFLFLSPSFNLTSFFPSSSISSPVLFLLSPFHLLHVFVSSV